MAESKKKAAKRAEVVIESAPAEASAKPESKMKAEKTPKPTAKAGKRSVKAAKEAEAEQAKVVRKSQTKSETAHTKETKKPPRTRLERAGKNYREVARQIKPEQFYNLAEALELATKTSPVKFDATVEMHLNLNVDPKQADQNIRGTVGLPAGSGKKSRVAVADDKVLAELDKGEINFDVLVAAPEMMPNLGKYAKLLGPKGLMPNPKSGTVTKDVGKAVKEAEAGKLEYRVDSAGIIHIAVGKVSFGQEKLQQNADAAVGAIKAAKPSGLKGNYMKSVYVTTSMGPGIPVDISSL